MLVGDDGGQGLAEYALILALVAVLSIGGLTSVRSSIDDALGRLGSTLAAGEHEPPGGGNGRGNNGSGQGNGGPSGNNPGNGDPGGNAGGGS